MHAEPRVEAQPSIRSGVATWMPRYEEFGYSRAEAEAVTRIAERLWNRYTAAGLTVDSPNPGPSALEPFEVLIQAICHFGIGAMFDDSRPFSKTTVH